MVLKRKCLSLEDYSFHIIKGKVSPSSLPSGWLHGVVAEVWTPEHVPPPPSASYDLQLLTVSLRNKPSSNSEAPLRKVEDA